MKTQSYLLLTLVAAAAFAGAAQPDPSGEERRRAEQPASELSANESGPGQTAEMAAQSTPETPAQDSQAAPVVPVTGSLDNTVRLNFREASLTAVLHYLSSTFGFIITGKTDLRAKVNIIANTPVSATDAIHLINEQLVSNGYQAVQTGTTLKIMSMADAKKAAGTPVYHGANPTNIPVSGLVVTQILPVRSLNPSQLTKDLQPLFPERDTIIPNEAGNALIMTAPQSDIHRLAQILQALDSTSLSDVRVFLLRFGDATAIASELKDIFTDPNAQQNTIRGPMRMRFGPGSGGGEAESSLPAARVNAVADAQGNAVLVSAPTELMESVSNLIAQLDQPSGKVTQVRVFRLKHADSTETANELAALFSDDGSNSNTGNPTMEFQFPGPGGGPGGPGGFGDGPGGGPPGFGGGPGGFEGGAGDTQQSDRAKRKSRVIAVADPRTDSVIVTAAKNLMDQIAQMIASLDSIDAHQQKLAFFALGHADPAEVQTLMQDLFQNPNTRTSSSSTTQSALQQRQTQLQQQNTSSTSSFGNQSGGTAASGAR